VDRTDDKIVVRTYCDTPDGELWQERVYFRDKPEVIRTRNWVKDVDRDFPIYLKYFFPDPSACDDNDIQAQKAGIGDHGVMGCCVNYPEIGLVYIDVLDGTEYDPQRSTPGGLERAAYMYYDRHELLQEYAEVFRNWAEAYTRRLLEGRPDFLLLGNSGTLVFNSPAIFRDLALPTLQMQTHLARDAGVPTILHSCGNQRLLVDICADETDLDCIIRAYKQRLPYGSSLVSGHNRHRARHGLFRGGSAL
jgi:uroporphyrinogen decarboxylase